MLYVRNDHFLNSPLTFESFESMQRHRTSKPYLDSQHLPARRVSEPGKLLSWIWVYAFGSFPYARSNGRVSLGLSISRSSSSIPHNHIHNHSHFIVLAMRPVFIPIVGSSIYQDLSDGVYTCRKGTIAVVVFSSSCDIGNLVAPSCCAPTK